MVEQGRGRQAFTLFCTLANISATCFGGGYAIIPLLQREFVEKRQWLTAQELADMFAVSQCTPGVIAVNAATYIGTRIGGIWGAVCATSGLLFPPICIISLVAALLSPYLSLPLVQDALVGLQAGVCAVILLAVLKLFREAVCSPATFVIFLLVCGLSLWGRLSPIVLVVSSAVFGFFFFAGKGGKGKS